MSFWETQRSRRFPARVLVPVGFKESVSGSFNSLNVKLFETFTGFDPSVRSSTCFPLVASCSEITLWILLVFCSTCRWGKLAEASGTVASTWMCLEIPDFRKPLITQLWCSLCLTVTVQSEKDLFYNCLVFFCSTELKENSFCHLALYRRPVWIHVKV